MTRKTGCPLSTNVNNIFSLILSLSPCGLSTLMEHHFFSNPDWRKDHCLVPSLRKEKNELSIWLAFFLVVF